MVPLMITLSTLILFSLAGAWSFVECSRGNLARGSTISIVAIAAAVSATIYFSENTTAVISVVSGSAGIAILTIIRRKPWVRL